MSDRVGFVILSHNRPRQLERLVRRLLASYDEPPIAIHHDFGQAPIRTQDFPSEVKFVSPHVSTRWGQFSLVDAALRALALLYRNANPNWFFLLSAADYPTMPADAVIAELDRIKVDALLDYRVVSKEAVRNCPPPENPCLQHYASPDNIELAWRRYVGMNIWIPIFRKGPRIGRLTLYLPVKAWRSPFSATFKCYFGDQWFGGSRKVAERLLNPTNTHLRLQHHLRLRVVPDECYYQTIIANEPDLSIVKATRRFTNWMDGGFHPRFLTLKDLPSIIESKSFFARKFSPDSQVLDEIDRML